MPTVVVPFWRDRRLLAGREVRADEATEDEEYRSNIEFAQKLGSVIRRGFPEAAEGVR
jgi:hypothetical protein